MKRNRAVEKMASGNGQKARESNGQINPTDKSNGHIQRTRNGQRTDIHTRARVWMSVLCPFRVRSICPLDLSVGFICPLDSLALLSVPGLALFSSYLFYRIFFSTDLFHLIFFNGSISSHLIFYLSLQKFLMRFHRNTAAKYFSMLFQI